METETINSLLDIKEIAKFMGVNERTIYRLLNARRMPGFKLGGKWVSDREVIKKWITRQINKNYAIKN